MQYKLEPAGRYVLVKTLTKEDVKNKGKKKDSIILVPEESNKQTDHYVVAELLSVGCECKNFHMLKNVTNTRTRYIVVQSNMIEKVKAFDQEYEVVQEQFVIGELEEE